MLEGSGAFSDLQEDAEREYSVKLVGKNFVTCALHPLGLQLAEDEKHTNVENIFSSLARRHVQPEPIYGAASKEVKFRGKQNLQSLLKQAYEFQSSSVATGKGKVCPLCQFENDPGAIFCSKCTNKFQIIPEANDQHTCLSYGTVMHAHGLLLPDDTDAAYSHDGDPNVLAQAIADEAPPAYGMYSAEDADITVYAAGQNLPANDDDSALIMMLNCWPL